MQLPEELRYSPDHEWVRSEGYLVRVGLTDYAQDQLGDIVYVELPAVGIHIAQGAVF
ncbi:MAG: glycine cleavage system protein H, partial [Syntrophobacterales bacterium CG03_land_8_20_14_0_80_58_14]